ncbi:cation:proton antiporter [Nanoarchaeota archaeon]
MASIFLILAVALIAATVIGYFFRALRQPLILAYIITGFLLGPQAFGLITDLEPVRVLSELGIAFLLFTVGLNMSMRNLKELGFVAMVTGITQVTVMTFLGFIISYYSGFSFISSLFIGIAIAFSSTIIIVKLLDEKNELNSMHGRISVGFLLVQDFIAIAALVLVAGMGTTGSFWLGLRDTSFNAIIFVVGVIIFTKYIIGPIFDLAARNQELLFLSSISYCFLLAITSSALGLSLEIGAFLAGVSLASLPYNLTIESKIKPLRDFFIVMFFLTLGAEMAFSLSGKILLPLIVLSLLVLIGTPVIMMVLMGLLGYRKRTSFLVGTTVAQISEFSLVLVALGYTLDLIPQDVVSLVTGIGVITITISAYMIIYGHKLYYALAERLKIFEKKDAFMEMQSFTAEPMSRHIILVGYHRIGFGIVNKLIDMNRKFLVVDYDPQSIMKLMQEDIPCIYGDIGDPEVYDKINLRGADIVISTAPDMEDNLRLMKKAREINPKIIVIIVAENVEEALDLYAEGADYVILPHLLGGHHASLLLEDIATDFDKLIETKLNHIKELKERKDIHPFHNRK